MLENIHVKNAVVGLQDAGGIPDAAGPNRHPGRYEVAVSKGDAEHGEIVAGTIGGMRQALKGADPQKRGEASELTGTPMSCSLSLSEGGFIFNKQGTCHGVIY